MNAILTNILPSQIHAIQQLISFWIKIYQTFPCQYSVITLLPCSFMVLLS